MAETVGFDSPTGSPNRDGVAAGAPRQRGPTSWFASDRLHDNAKSPPEGGPFA